MNVLLYVLYIFSFYFLFCFLIGLIIQWKKTNNKIKYILKKIFFSYFTILFKPHKKCKRNSETLLKVLIQ